MTKDERFGWLRGTGDERGVIFLKRNNEIAGYVMKNREISLQ